MQTYRITTLGCKVNQCESAALGCELEALGYKAAEAGQAVALVIVNTCTVTGKAAMQSRQAIRKAIREHPQAQIVVTGCYAQTAPMEIGGIDGVDLVVGHSAKLRLAEHLQRDPSHESSFAGCRVVHDDVFQNRRFAPLVSAAPQGKTRAFLKIQDGCNTRCSYCIVPYARGRSRSMPLEDVLNHIDALEKKGFKEIVLTGIHLGAYGQDLDPSATLTGLLSSIRSRTAVQRIRLSSIEPTEIDRGLLEGMQAPDTIICPHLHIPLQSGDNEILKRMGRPYTREQFGRVVEDVRRALPHAAIGADILVGFPGETDAAFEQTYALVDALPLTYLHVFPFSPRKGTPAAGFDGKVPERIVKQRCKRLRTLGGSKKTAFMQRMIGRTAQVLIQERDPEQAGFCTGISANYLPIRLATDATAATNTIVTARIKGLDADNFLRAVKT